MQRDAEGFADAAAIEAEIWREFFSPPDGDWPRPAVTLEQPHAVQADMARRDAALSLEFRAMRAELAELRDDHRELQRQLLAKADRRTGMRLAPAIARTVGEGRPFTVADLAALVLNADGPAAGVVRDALADHSDADGGFRGFGRLLQRLEGVPLAGWRIQRASGDRWRVVAGFPAK